MRVLVEKIFDFTQQFPLQRVFGLELVLKTHELALELTNLQPRDRRQQFQPFARGVEGRGPSGNQATNVNGGQQQSIADGQTAVVPLFQAAFEQVRRKSALASP